MHPSAQQLTAQYGKASRSAAGRRRTGRTAWCGAHELVIRGPYALREDRDMSTGLMARHHRPLRGFRRARERLEVRDFGASSGCGATLRLPQSITGGTRGLESRQRRPKIRQIRRLKI